MKTLRSLLLLAVLFSGVYLAFKLVPIYVSRFQFQEAVDDAAREIAMPYQRKSDEDFRNKLYQRAEELDIPVGPEDIKIERDGSVVNVKADYTVHVDLPVYPLDLSFHPASHR